MTAKGLELGMEDNLPAGRIPVHQRLRLVRQQFFQNAAKVLEGTLQSHDLVALPQAPKDIDVVTTGCKGLGHLLLTQLFAWIHLTNSKCSIF